jgi:hypothetical protein
MKTMIKALILLWLVPFGCLVCGLDIASKLCKLGYKMFHAAGTAVSVYIHDTMNKHGL